MKKVSLAALVLVGILAMIAGFDLTANALASGGDCCGFCGLE